MLSVLLSVYGKERPEYLQQALHSIWDGQSTKPDQIVLVKDGPLTDKLEEVVGHWSGFLGEKLTLVCLDRNVGLGEALNAGLAHCRYELVARMDTDDIAMPDRFKIQVDFMQKNADITASSAQIEEWDVTLEKKIGRRNLPLEAAAVARFAKRRSPLSHPVSIFRKTAVLEVGGYPPLRKAQDFALWSLLLVDGHKLANLPDMLLKMRTGEELLSRRGWAYFKQEIQLYSFQRRIGFLSLGDYLVNILSKGVLRLSPGFVKAAVYRLGR